VKRGKWEAIFNQGNYCKEFKDKILIEANKK